MPQTSKLLGFGYGQTDPRTQLGSRDLDPRVRYQILSDLSQQHLSADPITGRTGTTQEESSGLLPGIMDLLMRLGEYAPASFASGIHRGRGMGDILLDVGAEIFSGIGGIQGDKTTWTDYLRERGVENIQMGDLVPFLDDTWAGKVGTRGMAGLALSVFADPLTYITGGVKPVGQVMLKGMGKTYLNKTGRKAFTEMLEHERKAIPNIMEGLRKGAIKSEDKFFQVGQNLSTQANQLAYDRAGELFMTKYATWDGGVAKLSKEVLDPGGVRWAGITVMDSQQISKYVRAPLRKTLETIPGGNASMALGAKVGDSIHNSIGMAGRGMFKTWGKLQYMTKVEIREAAEELAKKQGISIAEAAGIIQKGDKAMINMAQRLAEDSTRLSAVLSTKAKEQLRSGMKVFDDDGVETVVVKPDFRQRYQDLDKKLEGRLGRYLYAVVDEEVDYLFPKIAHENMSEIKGIAEEMQGLGGAWSRLMTRAGALDETLPNWVPHHYENLNDLDTYHAALGGKFGTEISEDYKRHRVFEGYPEGTRVSQRDHAMSQKRLERGDIVRDYPILKPDYDMLGNFERLGDSMARDVARANARRQAASQFGLKIDGLDVAKLYHLGDTVIDKDNAAELADVRKIVKFWTRKGKKRKKEYKDLVKLNQHMVADAIGWDMKAGRYRSGRSGPIDFATELPPQLRPDRVKRLEQLIGESRELMETMGTENGRHEFMRQLFERIQKSENRWAVVHEGMLDYEDYFPNMQGFVNTEESSDFLRRWHKDGKYVPVTGNMWGDGAFMIPRRLRDEIENMDGSLLGGPAWKEFQPLIRGFDKVNNLFRYMAYTLFPMSATRDLYSGVSVNFLEMGLHTLDPNLTRNAMKMLAFDESKHMRKWHMGLSGSKYGDDLITTPTGSYTLREVYESFQDYGILQPGEVFAEMMETGKPWTKIGAKAKKFKSETTRVRGQIDNYNRFVMGLGQLKRGMSLRDAADRVREMHFMYQELSKFEREIAKRAFPFYTFTRKAMELSLKELKRRPGPLLGAYKAFAGPTSETEWMAKWESDGMRMRLGRDGNTVFMLNGIDLPFTTLNTMWGGTVEDTARGIAGMLSPAIRSPIEMMTGQSLFSGQKLKRQHHNPMGYAIDNLPVPKATKDWLGYRKDYTDGGRPVYSFDSKRLNILLTATFMGRFSSTARRLQIEAEGADTGGAAVSNMALTFLTGLRYREFNLDTEEGVDLRRRIRQLEEKLVDRGVMMDYQHRYIPKREGELQ